jgi:phage N-6-adenine-methyltransferase
MHSSNSEDWYAPLDLYQKLDQEFHFDIDPCAEKTNRLGCKIFYTAQDDGLAKIKDWPVGNVFCNPPYGRKGKGPLWVKKCAKHAAYGKGTAVLLIPSRTDTEWFHNHIWQKNNVEIRFLKSRLRFENPDHTLTDPAPFPSMVAIFRPPHSAKTDLI